MKSKNLSEKAAWDFYNNLTDEQKDRFGLNVINPAFVMGPLAVNLESASQKFYTWLIDGTFSKIPISYTSTVDVRDVADAHIKALTCEPGHRFAIVEGNYFQGKYIDVLQEKYNKEGFDIQYSIYSKLETWLRSFSSPEFAYYYQRWNAKCIIDNSKAKKMLDMDFIPMEKSTIDMAESLMDYGYVKRKS